MNSRDALRRVPTSCSSVEGLKSLGLVFAAVLASLCALTAGIAQADVVPTTPGPALAPVEVVASNPNDFGNSGIGSDGSRGVWFSELLDEDGVDTAELVHYSPELSGLQRVDLKPQGIQQGQNHGDVFGIAPGLQGEEVFARFEDNQLSQITPAGKLKNKTLPAKDAAPFDVAVDAQGNVWISSYGGHGGCVLVHTTPAGKELAHYDIGGECYELAIGPDGNIWVADYTANEVVEVSAISGARLATYSLRLPVGIARLGDSIFVSETEPGIIAKIGPSGELTEYVLPPSRHLEWMTAGPDNAVWFQENLGPDGESAIGRLTPSGELSELSIPRGVANIAATSDAIYFTGGQFANSALMREPLSNFTSPDPIYVALGDSYSSGEGNPPYEPQSDSTADHCHRSGIAYGSILDSSLALGGMTFKACSGAVTADFFDVNHEYPTEEKQLHWLSSETKTVTFTVGGNDAGFPWVLNHCVAGPRPTNEGFWRSFGCSKDKSLANEIKVRLSALSGTGSGATPTGQQIRSYAEVLSGIHSDAPNARIVIGLYPHLFGSEESTYERYVAAPRERACKVGTVKVAGVEEDLWVDYDDATWLNTQADKLNAVIKRAVTAAKKRGIPAAYAPPDFGGHGLCDTGESWINPIVLSSTNHPEPSSFHPTASGQKLGYEPVFAAQLK